MFLKSKSKKTAIVLSYCSLILQTLSTMVLTRFYLQELGVDSYGLYQMIYSVAQYILILDLGISTVMTRYISEYEAIGDKRKAENFAFHFAIIVITVVLVITIIGFVINSQIENIYPNLTLDEYLISHKLFALMIVQLVFTIISHYFRGLCEAYERFIFTRTVSIFQIIFNFVLAFILVQSDLGVIGIALANTVVIVFNTLATIIYTLLIAKFHVRFSNWEFSFFKPVFLMMIAMLLQSIVGHVNSSVDKTILGIMATKEDVAVYAVAATIITMFNTLPSTISSVFQPAATRMVVNKASTEQMTDFVIRPGRIQFIITGGFIAGFFVFGKDFISCWAGKGMKAAWVYVLLILLPNMVPLVQNNCLAILNAMDKRIYRSVILLGTTLLNVLLTILLVDRLGPIGAPISTGISYIVGHCILMNIYYQKKIGLNVRKMFVGIFKKIWICVVSSLLITLPLTYWNCNGNWLVLFAKALIYCIIYALLLFVYGLNDFEKSTLKDIKNKVLYKVKK